MSLNSNPIFIFSDMTQSEFNSYRFDTQNEPSDEHLGQLMENAAKKVSESNRESDCIFFEQLRHAIEDAKNRGAKLNKQ